MARSKLLLDENMGLKVYEELRGMDIDVQSVLLECRGCEDTRIIEMAKQHDKVIVTMDKDFGYLAISQRPPGIILLRLRDLSIPSRVAATLRAIRLGEGLYGHITVVAETVIRKRPLTP